MPALYMNVIYRKDVYLFSCYTPFSGIRSEGIYRVSATKSILISLRLALDEGERCYGVLGSVYNCLNTVKPLYSGHPWDVAN